MDPLFVSEPPESEIASSLKLWPELAGRRIRPVLISAFGDIYVETAGGQVMVADPLEISCETVAGSLSELESLFNDTAWASERLLIDLLYLARDRGIQRQQHQVFAAAPHPCFTGKLLVEHLVPMELSVWHGISTQLRAYASISRPGSPN